MKDKITKMVGAAMSVEKCAECRFANTHGAHQSLCCLTCECESLCEKGYRQEDDVKKETAIEIAKLVIDVYNAKEFVELSVTDFGRKIIDAIDKKYGGVECLKL